MKVSELMEGITPDPMFSGFVTADNMVLAVGLPGQDTNEEIKQNQKLLYHALQDIFVPTFRHI